jgi:hypothetical protein
VRGGKIKAYAVMARERSVAPEIPNDEGPACPASMSRRGTAWAPRGTPAAVSSG